MIRYRAAAPADAPALAAVGRASFTETFGHLYRPADLDHFLDRVFGPALACELADPGCRVRLALDDGAIVGFAKLAAAGLPSPARPDDLELKQLYVLRPWQGGGAAAALMDWAIACARADGAPRLLLSVYADNLRAQRFYARRGFREVGRNPFPVGDQIDDDRIWSLDL